MRSLPKMRPIVGSAFTHYLEQESGGG